MSVPTLPKGKSAILVMDCQNDIVHEQGKVGGSLTNGAMPRAIKEKNLLGTIKKLVEAGRAAQVPIIHVRHAYRPDYADMPDTGRSFGHETDASVAGGNLGRGDPRRSHSGALRLHPHENAGQRFLCEPVRRHPASSGNYASRAHWRGDGWRSRRYGPRWS